jgi:ApbE superfamily uncharacterized protein (UPF0280 family)
LPPRQPGGAPRWHWQHGPIDLIVEAEGDAAAVQAAHLAAWQRFEGLLVELVAELPSLRRPIDASTGNPLAGPVARRMWQACAPFVDAAPGAGRSPGPCFITPMAAVAGAVADALIGFYHRAGIRRAWINNGGDIALHLAEGERLALGLLADPGDLASDQGSRRLAQAVSGQARPDAAWNIEAATAVRGVATSGWRGRSHSLGVADAVTVLAASAADADAAATVLANAVSLPHPGIVRRPAQDLRDDSDLGDIPVTVQVPTFTEAECRQALSAGLAVASHWQAQGRLHAALLCCQGSFVVLRPSGTLQSTPSCRSSVFAT